MRVLVTGGAGYIGSHSIRALAASGHEVLVYDNLSTGFRSLIEGFELIVGDIADRAALSLALRGIDAVMHFAANAYVGESVMNPRKYFDNNISAALNLLNCAVDSGIRKFVFSSTCAVYGEPRQVPITEQTIPAPINPYGLSKLFIENALRAYDRAYGLKSVCLRYFNAAGADPQGRTGELHDPETHLVPLVLAAAARLQSDLTIFGDDYPTPDGTCIRDYIHVSDLARAHALALDYLVEGESTVFNLGTGRGYSVLEIVNTVEKITGLKVPVERRERREGDPPVLVADASKARDVLGWTAEHDLSDIVQHAWSWFQAKQSLNVQ